ncbi:alpha/beta hydrolase [Amycolatopsis sp. H20-H5]|uniref:alpha/beta hydrolase n=1 Tax=Amycolatopsis sp. H20-H5 TaxID=3046309 RepID=UPI002DB6B4B5|nr:alpha/beta hydrolase [Amycolatopsis sp. H20-H5]MEC3976145.1 alpha/beta hydrolase [Amycolatopsis sp. H20-H5]
MLFVDGWFGPEPEDWVARLDETLAILAVSSDDRWLTPERARSFAKDWGTRLVDVGPVGHLTGAHGPWPAGEPLLAELLGPADTTFQDPDRS